MVLSSLGKVPGILGVVLEGELLAGISALFGDRGALGREVSWCCGIWGLLGSPAVWRLNE